MGECFEHLITWQANTNECPLCRIDNLIADMSNNKTMYYGFEVAALIKQSAEQRLHLTGGTVAAQNTLFE